MLIQSQPGSRLRAHSAACTRRSHRTRHSPSHRLSNTGTVHSASSGLSASTTSHTGGTMKTRRHAVTLAATVMVVGCQMPPAPSTSRPPQPAPILIGNGAVSQQLIIKFKSNTIPCDAAGIASVSSATQVPLRHGRPMSGDACVVQQFADNAEGLSHEQERLKQHPAIEWLEEDRMMHPFLRMGGDSRSTVVEP